MNSQKGQALVEAVVALGVSVLIITGLLVVVTTSIANVTFSRNQAAATKYAEEGMELMRAYRDQNTWETFYSGCNTHSVGAIPSPTIFTRYINCTNINTTKVQVSITVNWVDSKGIHSSNLSSYLTKW